MVCGWGLRLLLNEEIRLRGVWKEDEEVYFIRKECVFFNNFL